MNTKLLNTYVVASAVLLISIAYAMAQTTNIIYQDNFARVGPLIYSAPAPVNNWYTNSTDGSNYETNGNNGTAMWWGCSNAANNEVVLTDGSEAAFTNVWVVASVEYMDYFLPFTPQVGHKYTLTASIYAISGNNNYLCYGFVNSAVTNKAFPSTSPQVGVAWLLEHVPGANIQSYYAGAETQLSLSPASGVTNTFEIVLDTTTGTATSGWTITWYALQSGVWTQARQVVASPNPTSIHYVGIGNNAGYGDIQNFSLTDVAYPSTVPTIIENPQNATVSVGQTATFWVNAAGIPSPVYQWETNAIGSTITNIITNAISATYTTPATTPAYNNLQYSCLVGNDAGAIVSAPATLTVVNTPATVFSAVKATAGITNNLTNVVVTFSKPVSAATALNPTNYTLNDGATVSSVNNYGSGSNSVLLLTSLLSTNASYNLSVSNVQDFFGNTMMGATMPVLPAGLAIHLRGDSGVILDNSGNVCEWMDQTTNGNNAVQNLAGGPTARPTPVPAVMNGEPALNFNGNTESNYLAAATSPSLAMTNNITIYAVVNIADFNAPREIVAKTTGLDAASYEYNANTSGQEVLLRGFGQDEGSFTSTAGATAGTPYVLATVMTGVTNGNGNGTVTHYLNGLANGSGTLTVPSTGIMRDNGDPLWIGGRDDFVQWMNGQMAEIMIFNTALSDADRTNVDNYLGQKYFQLTFSQNLPATLTSSNGFAVTYVIGANQGSAHLSYQWQVNGTNIPGANASTYTTPVLGPFNSNTLYDVEITTANGSTYYSATSTLDVLPAPPVVTSAGIPLWEATSPTNIMVLFNDSVSPATATVATNYTLNTGPSVASAAIGDEPNKVVLTTTAPLAAWNAAPGTYSLTVQNVQDLYGDVIVTASTPVGLYPNGVALWLKASAANVTVNGSSVSGWNDLSGNENDLYTISANEPQLATNANGDTVVRFVGTNDEEMDASSSPTLAITGDMSIFAVINFTALGEANADIVSKTGSGSQDSIPAPYDYYVAGSGATFLRGNGGSSGQGTSYGSFTATTTPSVGIPQIMAVSETGNTVSDFVNSQPAGSGLLSDNYQEVNDADAGNDLTIGSRAGNGTHLTGDYSELIVFSQVPSSDDMAALNMYFAAEYNIGLANPHPTNIVFSASNGNLTLSWPSDHTGWMLQAQTNSLSVGISTNWVNVSGSTTNNQVVIPVNLTNSSVFYRLTY